MKTLRTILSAVALLALAAGYFASQVYALSGGAAEWTPLIDTPLVVWLSLFLLVAAIALWLIPEREEAE